MEYLLAVDANHQEEKKLYATLFDLLSFEKIAFSGNFYLFIIIQFIYSFTLHSRMLCVYYHLMGACIQRLIMSGNPQKEKKRKEKNTRDGLLFTVLNARVPFHSACEVVVVFPVKALSISHFCYLKFTLPNESLIHVE